jgi:hypothetical protein
MTRFKRDPGPCPVDDAPHTTCTSPDYLGAAIAITQCPARDGVAPIPTVIDVQVPSVIAELRKPPLEAEVEDALPPGAVSTATYRRRPGELPGRPRRR